MRPTLKTIFLAGALLFFLWSSPLLHAGALTGQWMLSIDTPRGIQHPTLTVENNGDTYSGTYKSRRGPIHIKTISVQGDHFFFPLRLEVPIGVIEVNYRGTINHDKITGIVQNPRGEVPFSGTRVR